MIPLKKHSGKDKTLGTEIRLVVSRGWESGQEIVAKRARGNVSGSLEYSVS